MNRTYSSSNMEKAPPVITPKRNSLREVAVAYLSAKRARIGSGGRRIYELRPFSKHTPAAAGAEKNSWYVPSPALDRLRSSCETAYVLVEETTAEQRRVAEVIGDTRDPAAVTLAAAHRHGLVAAGKLPRLDVSRAQEVLATELDARGLIARRGEEVVFSVDPPGCVDVDDAVSVVLSSTPETSSSRLTVFVHIADPVSLISALSSDLRKSIVDTSMQRGFTTYLRDGVQIPILPAVLATNLCSLQQSKPRLAVTCELVLQEQEEMRQEEIIPEQILPEQIPLEETCYLPRVISARFFRNTVCNSAQLTYEDADNMLLQKCSNRKMATVSAALHKLNRILRANSDSHVIISKLMVLTNAAAARTLFETCINGTSASASAVPALLRRQLARSGPAEYLIQQKCEEPGIGGPPAADLLHHVSLGQSLYTHFTSPLRRAADQLVHAALLSVLPTSPTEATAAHLGVFCGFATSAQATVLNAVHAKQRRFQRDCDAVDMLVRLTSSNARRFSSGGIVYGHATISHFRWSEKHRVWKMDVQFRLERNECDESYLRAVPLTQQYDYYSGCVQYAKAMPAHIRISPCEKCCPPPNELDFTLTRMTAAESRVRIRIGEVIAIRAVYDPRAVFPKCMVCIQSDLLSTLLESA